MNSIIITSKTRMKCGYCVGAYDLDNDIYIRLLQYNGKNQPFDTKFQVGEHWSIRYLQSKDVYPPHVEDVLVLEAEYIGYIERFSNFLLNNVEFYDGDIEEVFDGFVNFTNNGAAYICEEDGIPKNSVGFWLIPDPLHLYSFFEKNRYKIQGSDCNFPYVGLQSPVQIIPKNTLVRLSLARWWKPDNSQDPRRCYVQLSGWY